MSDRAPNPGISCETDLGNLMAAVGNHEGKAVVLGGMEPGMAYGPQELHDDLFLAPQGEDPAHVGSSSNQLDYCEQSFEPAGLIRRSPVGMVEYRLTPFGAREGRSWAGHALALSLEAGDVGLRSLFGMTKTNGDKRSRPPMDRLTIFRMLLDAGPEGIQASEVQSRLAVNGRTAVNNLVWLDRDGIVAYETIDGREIADHIIYGLPERFELNGRPEGGEGSMPHMVHETLRSMVEEGKRHCSLAEFRELLEERYPEEGFDRTNRRSYALAVINELAAGGYITKGPVEGPRKSRVTLEESVRPVVEQAVELADRMQAGDRSFIREGRERLGAILDDELQVRRLITKAFRDSPTANRIPASQRFAHVRTVLAEGPLSSSQATALLRQYGMTVSCSRRTLNVMRKEGLLSSEEIPGGRELLWSLPA